MFQFNINIWFQLTKTIVLDLVLDNNPAEQLTEMKPQNEMSTSAAGLSEVFVYVCMYVIADKPCATCHSAPHCGFL